MEKTKRDLSVTAVCVLRSVEICKMRQARAKINAARSAISNCNSLFPHEGCLERLRNDLDTKILEQEHIIAKLLSPLFQTLNITLPSKFYFSTFDIRRGYVEIDEYVLLLRALTTSKKSDLFFEEGTIHLASAIEEELLELDDYVALTASIPLQIFIKQWYL